MAIFGVDWGSQPNVTSGATSLGESLAGAVGGPSGKMQAYMNEMAARQALLAAKTTGETQDNEFNKHKYDAINTAAAAYGDQLNGAGNPYGPKIGPAIVYSGKSATDLSTGMNTGVAQPMIVSGNPDTVRRGLDLTGHPAGRSDVVAAGDSIGTNEQIKIDAANPAHAGSGAKAAQAATDKVNNATDTLAQIQAAQDAYTKADQLGGVGPVAGSEVGRAYDKYGSYFGLPGSSTEAEAAREQYVQTRRALELTLAQMTMKGQGTITNPERQILSETLPLLDSADPRVAAAAFERLRGTAQAVIARNGGTAPEAPAAGGSEFSDGQIARNPKTGETIVFKNGVWAPAQ